MLLDAAFFFAGAFFLAGAFLAFALGAGFAFGAGGAGASTTGSGAGGAGGVGSPQLSWPRIAFASSLNFSSVASFSSNALRFARGIN